MPSEKRKSVPVGPEFYDAWTREGDPVLPLPLRELVTAPSSANAPTLAPETFTGDLLHTLRNGSDLGQVVAERHWLLDEGSAAVAATVEGRFTDGAPAFAVRELGRGRVVLCALPLGASLSQLPSRSHFVPLVHEIAAFLAHSSTAALNLAPSDGATILLSVPNRAGSAEEHGLRGTYYRRKGFQGMSIQRLDPAIDFDWGEAPPLRRIPRDNFSIRWTGSLTPPETGTIPFCVRGDADESDLAALSQEGLDAIRPFVELVTATTPDDLLKAVVGGRSFGTEVWRLLAYATLLLLVGEILLTRWIAIQRKTGGSCFGHAATPGELRHRNGSVLGDERPKLP